MRDRARIDGARPLYLRHLRIRNLRRFEHIELSFLDDDDRPRMSTLFLGRNGAGKTTLLQALALGLNPDHAGELAPEHGDAPWVREGTGSIELSLVDPHDRSIEHSVVTELSKGGVIRRTFEPDPFPWDRVFVAGYGSLRGLGRETRRSTSYDRRAAVASLLSKEPLSVDLFGIENELRARPGRLEGIFPLVEQLLRHLFDPQEKLPDDPLGLLQTFGDGDRALAAWLGDLCRWAVAAEQLDAAGFPHGIVLIDLLDIAMHPSRQKRLLPALRECLPGLQVIGTTHSPMTLVNASDQTLYAVQKEHDTSALRPLRAPKQRMADAVFCGEWFGLTSTLDQGSEELLTAFQQAVRDRLPREEIQRRRAAVEQRLGRLFESPLDPMAMEIAEETRRQAQEARSKTRSGLRERSTTRSVETTRDARPAGNEEVVEAARRLRERLRRRSFSAGHRSSEPPEEPRS